MACPNCGNDTDRDLLPVWEDDESDCHPDWVGCKRCHHLYRPFLTRDESDDPPPQIQLTDHEISRLRMGNQNTKCPTIVEW